MRSTELRTVRQVKVLLKAGDRAAALERLDLLIGGATHRSPPPVEQLVFAAITFECKRLRREDMTYSECIQKRGAVWPSGRRKGKPKALECQGCELGAAIAFSCPGVVLRPSSQPPEVLPASQRMAKRARELVGLESLEPVGLDPLTEAAMCSPDEDKVPL